jgi:dihydrofolate synthase / folylpolyglutamate synthase
LKVIHVAGTSGKTSTAYYIAALLAAAGKKTGLAVSPHIDIITERIQINGQNISEADFCSELEVFLDLAAAADPRPSYFELFHAFTLWAMKRQNADYVVIETGVGGLHDATNITNRADKICVITDIGFDHTELLGDTLAKIAAQKVGIVHEDNHIFMYEQAEEIMAVVKNWAGQHHAPLHVTTEAAKARAYADDLSSMPDYQRRNWLLAHYVYTYLRKQDNAQSLTRQVLRQTQRLQVPARMDIKQFGGKTLVMDGAHNPQKMVAFLDSFRRLYPDVKPAVLIGLKEDKEYQELVSLLTPLAGRIITTAFKTTQDLPVVSMKPGILAQAFSDAGLARVESIPDSRAAFQALLAAPEAVCVITGSFYLIGQIRNNEHLA